MSKQQKKKGPNAQNLYILIGLSGSTKTQYLHKYIKDNDLKDYQILSNDVSKSNFEKFKKSKSITNQNTFIDNTNLTIENRKNLIEIAEQNNMNVFGIYIQSSFEDCQIRILLRMYKKYKRIAFDNDGIKDLKQQSKDEYNDLIPIQGLFKQRKIFQQPKIEEGFTKIICLQSEPIDWNPKIYKKKGLFLDIDGTIRDTKDLPKKYPEKTSQVKLLFDKQQMKDKLQQYIENGYQIIGVSNQSGISNDVITTEMTIQCFEKTIKLLDLNPEQFPIYFCPHKAFPVQCYCRKPQVGMGVEAILKYKISPSQSIMVGDQTSDKTFASKLKIQFINAKDFWKDV